MTRKRFFGLIAAFALAVVLLPALTTPVFADNTISVSTYTGLLNAMAKAYDDDTTIRLSQDIIQKDSSSGLYIAANSSATYPLTLDLNGHTLARETSGTDIMLLTFKPNKGPITVTDSSSARTGMLYFKNTNPDTTKVNTTMVININGHDSYFEVVLDVPGCYNASAAPINHCIYGDQAAGRIKGGCYYSRDSAVYLNYGYTTNSFSIEGGSFYSMLECPFFATNNTAEGNVYVYKGYFGRVSPNQTVSSNCLFYIGSDLAFTHFVSHANNVTVNGSTRDISKTSRAVNGLTDIGVGEFIVGGETRVLLDMPANTPTANTQAPVITQQPQSASAAVGGTLTFSVTASNVAAYSWSVCDAEYGQPYGWTTVKAHAAVSGETTAAMTLKPTDAWLNGKAVYCDIKGTDGNWYSSSVADITVTDGTVPAPTITTQPVGQASAKTGTPVTLSVSASGTGTLSYQWYQTTVNDISTILADTTALSSTYTVPETPGTVYYCVGVTNTVGGKASAVVYSNLVAVTYKSAPAIIVQPADGTGIVGGSVTFSVSATGDNLQYEWFAIIDGSPHSYGKDSSSTFTMTKLQLSYSGMQGYVVVSNDYGSVTSDTVTLTVKNPSELSAAPTVSYDKASAIVKKGESVTLHASVAMGDGVVGTISYQWYEGTSNIPGTAAAIGETNYNSLMVGADMAEGETRYYYCIATNTVDGVDTDSFADDMPIVKVTVNSGAASFTDVPADAFYTDAVGWAVKSGITTGTSATTFAPEDSCSRGQTVTFLWRFIGSPAPSGGVNPFVDVSKGDYFYDSVLWAVENSITKGTSASTFSPGDNTTRGQFVTLLWRLAGFPASSTASAFTDVSDPSAYYYDAVLWAAGKGITQGTSSTTFSPETVCTRGQVVTFLYRYFKG